MLYTTVLDTNTLHVFVIRHIICFLILPFEELLATGIYCASKAAVQRKIMKQA